jgi:hypothetical protein
MVMNMYKQLPVLLLWPLLAGAQDEAKFSQVPYKPESEVEVNLDYQFKQRPPADPFTWNVNETRKDYDRKMDMSQLPYLMVDVIVTAVQPDEKRVRVVKGDHVALNKKITQGMHLSVDFGFTADIKDRIIPHVIYILFMDENRDDLRKVVLLVEEDGTFRVNGEKRGQL